MPTATRSPANQAPHRSIDDVEFGDGVVVQSFTNLYGCRIGDRTRIGTFVEVQRGAEIGAACKIQSHTFICDGVKIVECWFGPYYFSHLDIRCFACLWVSVPFAWSDTK